ncbi:little elongation complex subunit 2 [Lucilia cuprina]|uniref:little elongation complex subunit 2 n=1 Tax=Lucilia cuprina TaxID=7375 RepID=UPI001F050901|nr:little elongation complex subunit 2 [Lucilia cuprina]
MSNFDYLSYKGNAIFRNQPNHSYFDKPFEDEQDCLFQTLHEIDPHFLTPEEKAQTLKITCVTVIDPRTQKPINQLCYDHTQEEKTQKFNSPKRSMMTEKQHELGVKVLNALQQCLEVDEENMFNWYRLQKIRVNEKEYFQRYVFELSQVNKEQMYAPCRKLLELYQKWYKQKVIKLIKKYPAESYNTHLGLPQVRQCKNVLSDEQAEITQPEIVTKLGAECLWQDDTKQEIKKLKHSISSYEEIYINSEDLKESLEEQLKTQFEKLLEDEMEEKSIFYIPLESLLFLLTAGDYVDMPMEMLLNIKETENLEGITKRYLIMEQPLPPRQAGWHTYQQVVEQAIKGMLSVKQLNTQEKENLHTEMGVDNSPEYKISTIEEFMQKTTTKVNKLCKFSKVLTKWQLGTLEDNAPLKIFTSIESFVENKDVSIKLEFKAKFGCEIFTKYDLLKEWFKLKLLQKTKTHCLRLDTTNYQALLEETLSIRKLEEYLLVYHINCQQLLNNLYEFLKMLYNMPLGHYMLRYNPKFKDKLMLCKPSQEIAQNTINLHQLLQTDVTDLQFMTDQNFLLINENLCSLMHLQHGILPAAFCPRTQPKKVMSSGHLSKQKTAVKQPVKEIKKPAKNKTQMKRARRRQRLYEEIKTKKDEMKELMQEMELDRKMLNM